MLNQITCQRSTSLLTIRPHLTPFVHPFSVVIMYYVCSMQINVMLLCYVRFQYVMLCCVLFCSFLFLSVMLCYAVLCYVMWRYVTLRFATLRYVMLCYAHAKL